MASLTLKDIPPGLLDRLRFMCQDLDATVKELTDKPGITFRGVPEDQGWGVVITMLLPGGLEILLYEPRHPTAI
jgi:hypothetical protein